MSTVSPVSNSYAATEAANTTSSATGAKKVLGQEDFLKLLAQQFQSQDPMKPMDDTTFIASMAQFTSLQQTTDISKTLATMQEQQSLVTANSYLGHNVTVDIGDGQTISGPVSGIKVSDGTPKLIVGQSLYDISSVLLVEPAAVTASSSKTTTGE
ncbi:flagellar hook capping FlgD N-terminal domain-containing protein [Opitutus sp. ER46]|uniref:flagellar hook capping FlgD N-terminal domain-containing protein n=1 Tax=Opitutus sp. ER46 TaxID=2161864 RepID=UPI000D31748E|nr:flagellar hook capping FlgD N-terminal domain-containing protein [Opitutus sp. ER46]PTX90903.1 flagellar hook capping protein [Opitutus sp. ER46]